jgi:protein tyrosine phosphatase (PTP) superfamily phosphohydrolase (DUF442 family)
MVRSRRIFIVLVSLGIQAIAQPAPGIGNFERVDEHVLRGAQPTAEGLHGAGNRGRIEEKQVTAAGMQYISIPMSGTAAPTAAQIAKALDLLEDITSGPVFVHCLRGADRTGTVVAAYHIEHDHWDQARALQDARQHGMSPLQMPRMRYIRAFQARKRSADAAAPTTSSK